MLRTSLTILASLVAAGSILAGTASQAFAAAPDTQTRIVSYADLNLASARGRERLEARLEAAVRDVCGVAIPGDLVAHFQVKDCRTESLAAAHGQWRRGDVRITIRTGAAPLVAFSR